MGDRREEMHQKRAIVTGAGKGIGKEICEALIAQGCRVAAVTRTASDLDAFPSSVVKVACGDLATNAREAAERTLEELGGCDYLVNNAGIYIGKTLLEIEDEDFEATMNVNLKAAMIFTQLCAKRMIADGIKHGSIVNVSSQASYVAIPNHATYCMSKAAMDMLTKSTALELAPHNIRCNAVNPTVVLTDMGRKTWSAEDKARPMLNAIPLSRFAEESEIVRPVLFLLSTDSAMVTGTTMPIDGGLLATLTLKSQG